MNLKHRMDENTPEKEQPDIRRGQGDLATRFAYAFWILAPFILISVVILVANAGNAPAPTPADDVEDLNQLLDDFEEAYSNEQLYELRQLFYAEAVVAYDFQEGTRQRVHAIDEWLRLTQENTFDVHENISDELTDREIQVYRNIAYAVCDYTYRDETKVGRGVDIFTFLKMRDRWKILSLQFTGEEVVQD